jgi:large subunit ribosomal protein L18
MDATKKKHQLRRKRHRRLRRKLSGTPDRPRLCVFRSNKHIYAQVIDDWNGRTLTSASTLSDELEDLETTWNKEAAARVGELIGRKCIENDITKVVFDRGGFQYQGRVEALAEGARKSFEDAEAEGF